MSSTDAEESIQQLLLSLEQLSPQLEGREEDLAFVREIIQTNEFHSLMKVHHEVTTATSNPQKPASYSALTLAHTVAYDLEACPIPEAQELFDLLSAPHTDSLLSAHDRVANKEYPYSSVAVDESTIDEQMVKMVRIEKKKDPLGATVKAKKDGTIVISRVLCGGAADKSGLLHPGDIIHEINGSNIHGYTVDDVADLMKGLTGTIVFKITPAIGESRPKRRNQAPVYMRTFFAYNPSNDTHMPCPEAGLKFERGSILQVMNQDDPNWWQAVKLGDRKTAGIIPSQKLRERRECYEFYGNQQQRRRSKSKKALYSSFESESYGKEIPTYEEMAMIDALTERPRPIMLVAPRGGPMDMDELKTKLISEKPGKFGAPLAHTSRSPRPNEVSGQHYFFVSRQQMERDIQSNQFVEHGFLSGNYYGTSVNSIHSVVDSGKQCILTLIPQAMKLVHTPEVKAFVVYFRPPTAEWMRKHWLPKGLIRESRIADIFRQAGYLERTYSHYFDHSILFKDVDTACYELVKIADRLLQDQQWVPATWVNK